MGNSIQKNSEKKKFLSSTKFFSPQKKRMTGQDHLSIENKKKSSILSMHQDLKTCNNINNIEAKKTNIY